MIDILGQRAWEVRPVVLLPSLIRQLFDGLALPT
jgi:hypothetical protein